jgi:LmbE family N-acetylglucosaminyl deacetylase
LNTEAGKLGKVLVLVAHPDDETIGCSGLLQRASSALVVFAVDGAPPHYGFEKRYGSLKQYSDTRFLEASLALNALPHCSFGRLVRQNGAYYVDQHLFERMPEALASLNQFVCRFSPDFIVTHAYEGGHIDHDACHFLAAHIARAHNLMLMEFPSYSKAEDGRDIFQRFRNSQANEVILKLREHEIEIKRQMLASYRTQQALTPVFQLHTERFRPALQDSHTECAWTDYAFENRRRRLRVKFLLEKIENLNRTVLAIA